MLRIGYYHLGDEDFGALAESALNFAFSSVSARENLEVANEKRDEREFRLAAASSNHANLLSDKSKTETADFAYASYLEEKEPFVIAQISVTPEQEEYLKNKDFEALEYFMMRDSLDILAIFFSRRDGALLYYEGYLFKEDETFFLCDSLAMANSLQQIFPELVNAIYRSIDPTLGALRLQGYRVGTRFFIDEQEAHPTADMLLLPEGTYSLTIRTPGFESLTETVEITAGEMFVSTHEMTADNLDPTVFTSVPYDAKISLFGLDDVPLPLSVSSFSSPLIVSISSDGFLSRSLQISKVEPIMKISLTPEWMSRDGRVEEAKTDFYKSMRNTLLALGSYALVSSLENIYPNTSFVNYSQALKIAAIGASVITALDLVHDIGIYYNTARQTYI